MSVHDGPEYAILYEMLTGRVPFDADTPLATAMKHKLEAARDPRELNVSIPAGLGRLILKCLEKDKDRRYQSAANAQFLVAGSVMKVGQKTIITVRLQKASTGDVVRSEKIESLKDQEILPKLDALAAGIKADLNLEPRDPDAHRLTGDIASLRGDHGASEREYRSALELADTQDQRITRGRLALLYVAQGRFEKGREETRVSTRTIGCDKNIDNTRTGPHSRAEATACGKQLWCSSGSRSRICPPTSHARPWCWPAWVGMMGFSAQ